MPRCFDELPSIQSELPTCGAKRRKRWAVDTLSLAAIYTMPLSWTNGILSHELAMASHRNQMLMCARQVYNAGILSHEFAMACHRNEMLMCARQAYNAMPRTSAFFSTFLNFRRKINIEVVNYFKLLRLIYYRSKVLFARHNITLFIIR